MEASLQLRIHQGTAVLLVEAKELLKILVLLCRFLDSVVVQLLEELLGRDELEVKRLRLGLHRLRNHNILHEFLQTLLQFGLVLPILEMIQ